MLLEVYSNIYRVFVSLISLNFRSESRCERRSTPNLHPSHPDSQRTKCFDQRPRRYVCNNSSYGFDLTLTLLHPLAGNLFEVLRAHAPRWYQVACEAYIAVYSWHGTTDARSLLPALVLTMIHKAIDTFVAIDPTWIVEDGKHINPSFSSKTDDHWRVTQY